MKRAVVVLVVVVALMAMSADAKKKPSLPAELLKAKFVTVMIYPNGTENVRGNNVSFGADRRALANVETAIKKWGRWTVLSSEDQADIVIAVRKGRGPSESVGVPGTTYPPSIGVSTGVEVGPSEDMIAIYAAHRGAENSVWHRGDTPIDGVLLWRVIQSGALSGPEVPGIQQLRKQIEQAETEKAKK